MKKRLQQQSKLRRLASEKKFKYALGRKNKTYGRVFHLVSRKVGDSYFIKAPVYVSIYSASENSSPYEKTMKFINEVKQLIPRNKCILDFRETEFITAAALVVIYAELDFFLRKSNVKHKIFLPMQSKSVSRAIRNSGLTRLINRRAFEGNLEVLEKLPVIRGVGNEYLEEIIDHIQKSAYEDRMDPNTEFLFGDAVSETINNVGRHAYPAANDNEKEWWLICEVLNQQLFLAIYDRGVGIPKTVVDQPWFLFSLKSTYPDQYKAITEALDETGSNWKFYAVRRLKDSELIYISMKGDVTGMKQKKHGQGSKSIKALVNDTENGKLWVFSKKGLFVFEDADEIPQLYKLPTEFSGTLLQWNIKIK